MGAGQKIIVRFQYVVHVHTADPYNMFTHLTNTVQQNQLYVRKWWKTPKKLRMAFLQCFGSSRFRANQRLTGYST